MREFIKSFLSFGLASTIERLIAFLLLPIYTHYFTTAEFGIIDLIQVLIGVISIFAHLQLETSLQRYYFDNEGEEKRSFIFTIISVITAMSLVITVLLVVFSREISILIFKNGGYANLIKLAALQLTFANYSMLALVVLRYEKKNISFTVMILAKVLLTVIFILLFVVWLKKGLYGVFYAQLISLIISSAILFVLIRKFNVYKLSYTFLKKSIIYAFPQFPARIGSVLLSYANRFFMVGYLTIASIGIFSLSLKLAAILQLIYTAFVMAWDPFMFEQKKNPDHKKVFAQILLIVSAPVFLIVSIVSLFSQNIVFIVASKQFNSASQYLGGLCLYFALLIFKEVVDIGPKFTEKTKYLSYTFFFSVIVNLVSLYFFIKLYGLLGVVYSMLLTNIVLLIISWVISNKLYYISHHVYQFILMALPAFILAILSMYKSQALFIKVPVCLGILIFYSWIFFRDFKLLNIQKHSKSNI